MATGCHTCGGTLTGPVGTTREASKVTMVFETVSVCGARVPVPLVTKAPEAPPTAQSVVLNWPVILRVSSLCHAPASSMLPPVQARKRAVLSEILNRITEIHHDREIDRCRHDGRRVTVNRIASGEIEQDSPVHIYPISCNMLESVSCGLKVISDHGRSNI